MIDEVSIANVATFGSKPEKFSRLSKFNFVFGSNGTGKTTISRVIENCDRFPDDYRNCKVVWQGGTKLETITYNRDFVERNFNSSEELPGVFTLGEDQVDVLKRLNDAKASRHNLLRTKESQREELEGSDGQGGKLAQLRELQKTTIDKCWSKMKKHTEAFHHAFQGFRNSKQKFWEKIETERSTNSALLLPLDDLMSASDSIFQSSPDYHQKVALIDPSCLFTHESNKVLETIVIGKHDVDISAMIERLGCGDWVLAGKKYYDANDGYCPFCQQSTNEEFAQNLAAYFDEKYLKQINSIDRLIAGYKSDAANVQLQLEEVIQSQNKFLDIEKIKTLKLQIDSLIVNNVQTLEGKKREPSRSVKLESLHCVIEALNLQIQSANSHIDEHNRRVANINSERRKLTSQVWRFLLDQLEVVLDTYDKKLSDLNYAINSLNAAKCEIESQIAQCDTEIAQLEKQVTSVQPTIDGINTILQSFGFNNFSISRGSSDSTYQLVRPSGVEAQQTLSEGERAFISFLYFYHLLDGSNSDSGIVSDRVAVFDDPVSSLDSNVLYIVSSLIREIMNDVRENRGKVRQVFVLTHNVFFHREITFNPRRQNNALSEETFWIVRKSSSKTQLARYSSNPIQTAYELLWAEVFRKRESDDHMMQNLTIQNELRRILEYYFKMLGGVDKQDICSRFEGKEKMICISLFSWTNSGSHAVNDDLFVSVDPAVVDKYLEVFHKIFDKTGHISHYKMMRESVERRNSLEC